MRKSRVFQYISKENGVSLCVENTRKLIVSKADKCNIRGGGILRGLLARFLGHVGRDVERFLGSFREGC